MGYGERNNGQIKTFWPDDTDTEKYLEFNFIPFSMKELQEKIKEWWPEAKPEEIDIAPKYIHTDCLYYDQYDPSDYTLFLHIIWNKPQEQK